MSRSLSSLAKRRKTIQTTQKITNAMKLVSMSRVQKYRREQLKYEPVYKHVLNIPVNHMLVIRNVYTWHLFQI